LNLPFGTPDRISFWGDKLSSIRREPLKTKQKFTVLIERDEAGYYVATVPALKGCHTQAKNLDTLMKRVQEVIELCLEAEGRPAGSLELVGIQLVAV
jgi:predicted RNase H-like HicB family nuclease